MDSTSKMFMTAMITQAAATSDLPSGLAAVQAMPAGGDRMITMDTLLVAAATVDPKTAFNLALTFQGPPEVQRQVLRDVASSIGKDDPEMVLDMAKNVADPKARQALEAGALPTLTQQDPQSAWTYATTQFSGPDQVAALGTVCHDAARNNPDMVAG